MQYTEDVSKTNQGGLKHRKKEPKVVVQYENTEEPSKCIVHLYKEYNRRCPENRPDHAFYLKPLTKPKGECWYSCQAIGHNNLSNTVKRLCKEADVTGYFASHSLRATAATRLFEAQVDEQLIMQRTGHSTTSGVRSYKRLGEKLKSMTSDVLNKCENEKAMTKKTSSSMSTVNCGNFKGMPSNFSPVFQLQNATNVNITLNVGSSTLNSERPRV